MSASLPLFLPPRFHIFIRPFATAYPFPSQRSLCKILSSERCVRFRVRVRIPVCVSPGQVNDPCAWREGSGGGGRKSGKGVNEGRDGETRSSRYCALPVNALLSLCAMRRKKKRKKRVRARALHHSWCVTCVRGIALVAGCIIQWYIRFCRTEESGMTLPCADTIG